MKPLAPIANRRARLIVVLAASVGSVFAGGSAPAADASDASPSATDAMTQSVRVSPRDSRYLELSDGTPYIPNGLNVIHPQGGVSTEEGLAQMEKWMKALADNGGNYIRVWMSAPFWDAEHEQAGVFDEARAQRVDALLELARRYGIRVKMTIDHPRLRVYVLRGKQTSLLWCRDTENTWQTELEQGRVAEELKDVVVPLNDVLPSAGRAAHAYDPWKKTWTKALIEGDAVRLPAFARSIVVRIEKGDGSLFRRDAASAGP